jgi:ETC complex I subunit conserved region
MSCRKRKAVLPAAPSRFRGVAQSGSASGLGPEGRGFKSCRPDHRDLGQSANAPRFGHGRKIGATRRKHGIAIMSSARIYRPAKTAMQSGQSKDRWLFEFEPETARSFDPLMGTVASTDMKSQIKLWFDSKELAVAYALKNGIAYRVEDPQEAIRKPVSYSDNFKVSRVGQWTH